MAQLPDIPERAELWDYQEREAAGGGEGLGLGYKGARGGWWYMFNKNHRPGHGKDECQGL